MKDDKNPDDLEEFLNYDSASEGTESEIFDQASVDRDEILAELDSLIQTIDQYEDDEEVQKIASPLKALIQQCIDYPDDYPMNIAQVREFKYKIQHDRKLGKIVEVMNNVIEKNRDYIDSQQQMSEQDSLDSELMKLNEDFAISMEGKDADKDSNELQELILNCYSDPENYPLNLNDIKDVQVAMESFDHQQALIFLKAAVERNREQQISSNSPAEVSQQAPPAEPTQRPAAPNYPPSQPIRDLPKSDTQEKDSKSSSFSLTEIPIIKLFISKKNDKTVEYVNTECDRLLKMAGNNKTLKANIQAVRDEVKAMAMQNKVINIADMKIILQSAEGQCKKEMEKTKGNPRLG